MLSVKKKRLSSILFLVVTLGLAMFFILRALSMNIDYYRTPSEIVSMNLVNKSLRLGGMVEKGSIQRGKDLQVSFRVSDYNESLEVQYEGILPDLFKEGSGVVVMGRYENGLFKAQSVLAKHDENYMPPEVTRMMNKEKS